MIQTNITSSYTEIYSGGNFITENFPTNFHTFTTRKILTKNDDISNYKEITAAQRAALEASDAAWTRPPQSFIDLWNARSVVSLKLPGCQNGYNELTGFFELNGLNDLTYDDAVAIFSCSPLRSSDQNVLVYGGATRCRTNFCETKNKGIFPIFNRTFQGNLAIEVAVAYGEVSVECFSDCKSVRVIRARFITHVKPDMANLPALEDLNIGVVDYRADLAFDLNIGGSPLLSLKSIKGIFEYRTRTNPITVSVHPDVYAKLTDPDNEEWYPLLAQAAEKNIQFATT